MSSDANQSRQPSEENSATDKEAMPNSMSGSNPSNQAGDAADTENRQATAVLPRSEKQAPPEEASADNADAGSDQPARAEQPTSVTALGPRKIKIGSQRDTEQKKDASPSPSTSKGRRRERPASKGQSAKPGSSPTGQPPKTSDSSKDTKPAGKTPPQGAPVHIPKPIPKPVGSAAPNVDDEVEAALEGISIDEALADNKTEADETGLKPETRMKARVVRLHRENVFVELGGRHQGVIPAKQFKEPPEVDSEIDVTINRFNPEEGLYEVSRADAITGVADWSQVAEGMTVEARVTGHNKGGLECEVNSLRGFMPASQIALYRVDNLEELVGEKYTCVVTEVKPKRRRLVISRRAVLEREREEAKEKLRASLAPGQTHEGVVRNIRDFGAFVDLGGIDGMVHVSQMSWARVNHPSDVLEVGQTVKVKVTKIDEKTGKISLAMKELAANPWDGVEGKYPVSSRVKGKVSRIADFGAFVQLEAGVEGLVHISELAHHRVVRVNDVVSEGQEVEASVLAVDRDKQRIGLSLKALQPKPEPAAGRSRKSEPEPEVPAYKPTNKNLKGGLGGPSGGEQFGLKW